MTKKDYELIASIFNEYLEAFTKSEELILHYRVTGSSVTKEMILRFARELQKENPRFDKDKFAKACGMNKAV